MINARISGVVVEEPQYSHKVHERVYYKFVLGSKRDSGVIDYIDVSMPKMTIVVPRVGNMVIVHGDLRSYMYEAGKTCSYLYAKFVENNTDPFDVNEVYGDAIILKKRGLRRTTRSNNPIIDFVLKSERTNGVTSVPAIAWFQWSDVVNNMGIGTEVEFCGRFQSREYKKVEEGGSLITRTTHEISISEIKAKEE